MLALSAGSWMKLSPPPFLRSAAKACVPMGAQARASAVASMTAATRGVGRGMAARARRGG